MARGRYAITNLGVPSELTEMQEQGAAKNVKYLDLPEAAAVTSSGGLFLAHRAPHPNAAKLFVNWVLSKEGQDAWCAANQWNSRRLDVAPRDPDAVPRPGVKYFSGSSEANFPALEETQKWLNILVK